MPITKITLENFKGISDRTEVELKPITVLFGANSAGKSTLLQAMLYLRELLERRNADADQLQASGASIDLGGFRQFVHGHELDRTIRIGVAIDVRTTPLPVPVLPALYAAESEGIQEFAESGLANISEVGVTLSVRWSHITETPQIESYEVSWDGRPFARLEAASERQCNLVFCNTEHPSLLSEFQSELDQDEPPEECLGLFDYLQSQNTNQDSPETLLVPTNLGSVIPEDLQQVLRIPDQAYGWEPKRNESDYQELLNYGRAQIILSQLISGSKEVILKELKKIRYVGPLRAVPPRNFESLRSPREDRWSDGLAAWDALYKSASIPDGNGLVLATSEWLSDRLDLGYSLSSRKFFEVEQEGLAYLALLQLAESALDEDVEDRIRQILKDVKESPVRTVLALVDARSGTTVAPCDIGVGVSQVVPVVVGAIGSGGRTVVVEQPELHLHPAVQARMGDLFINGALDTGNRFILESHSEHLMLRLLRRIRETSEDDEDYPDYLKALKPDDVSVYYVQADAGSTQMVRLRVSEDGDFLDRWPHGFFDERAEELF